MEAKSIESISEIMRYDGLGYSSVGTISQTLTTIGGVLPNVQSIEIDKKMYITAVADEIFIGKQPILITLEPISSVILSIELAKDRTEESWEEHLSKIDEKMEITSMVTDEGKGLRSATNKRGIAWQPDTYHAIAHRLGKWVSKLEARAYKRIEIEYERKRVIKSAKTQKVINQRRYKYSKAKKKTLEAIELYENFIYLYLHIIKELQPFHSNGKLRDKKQAKENMKIALELMTTLKNEPINKEIEKIERILPKLLNYFNEAKKVIRRCKELGFNDESITNLTLAWQWNKALIKAKKKERIKRAKAEYLFYMTYAKDTLQDKFEDVRKAIFRELDHIIQASSMVENINSILRPYLNNAKNQISQKFLNLFMFYHNHRRYKDGKRKGKTPMEILTGKKQDKKWVELLADFIEKSDADFFL